MNLECNANYVSDKVKEGYLAPGLMVTPLLDGEDYWIFKVQLTTEQALIAFPKFSTYGIGFLKEEDWNTNLPYSCETEEIYNHIRHNKGDKKITKQRCIKAIEILQNACKNINS